MKKYVLGNYELSLPDIVLLTNCILDRLEYNADYREFGGFNKLNELYEIEDKHLRLMLEQLKRYGD